jgi:hypothetical protein
MEVRETIKQALALEGKQVATADFLNDLIESVCLLQMEGLQYQFTHRSFQEYFAACFIGRSPPNLGAMLDQFCRRRQDEVIPMAFAMNKRLIEREWIIPKLLEFQAIAAKFSPKKEPIAYADAVFGGLMLTHRGKSGGTFTYAAITPLGLAILLIQRLYGSRFAGYPDKNDPKVIKSALKAMAEADDVRLSKTPGDRIRSGGISLTSSDTWVARSGIPSYFDAQRTVSLKLLQEINAAAADQNSALKDLI